MASYEDIIAINSGNKLRFIDLNARQLAEYTSKDTINEVFFISRRVVLVVCKNKYSVLQMK